MKQITQNLRWLITLLVMIVSVGAWADDFERYSGEITEGDYVICCYNTNTKTYDAMVAAIISSDAQRFSAAQVTPTNDDVIISTNSTNDKTIIWHIAPSGNYWTIYNASEEKYAASTGTRYQAQLLESGSDDKSLWTFDNNVTTTIKINGVNTSIPSYSIKSKYDTYPNLYYYSSSFSCSSSSSKFILYKKVTVATPTFTPEGEDLTQPFTLTIDCETTGANIYYTTDGTPPSATNGTLYENGITISETTTVKAIAIKYGVSSEIVSATYAPLITTIPNLAKLEEFRDQVNSGVDYTGQTVTVTGNIDMSGVDNWTPIGNVYPFTGTFDGGSESNFTISNLHISSSTDAVKLTGLFGKIMNGAIVKNVQLSDVSINISYDEDLGGFFGCLVGYAGRTSGNTPLIENCKVLSGSISCGSQNNVGAIAGFALESTVRNCDNHATINGHENTGGIVGNAQTSTIEDCGNFATIGGNENTGGIVGYNSFSNCVVKKCFNKGLVTGYGDNIGGIIGNSINAVISHCYNTGNIVQGNNTTADNVGGIIGYVYGTISYCYNTGSITGNNSVGGIVGQGLSYDGSHSYSYDHCYNTGYIRGRTGDMGYVLHGAGGTPDADDTHHNYIYDSANPDNLTGWNLYGGGDDKIGLGTASDGDSRNWVFVNQNTPLLYGVRGQVITLGGKNGFSLNREKECLYTSFSSDVRFSTVEGTSAFWVQKDEYDGDAFFDEYNFSKDAETTMIITHETGVLYPYNSQRQQLGYVLQSTTTGASKLELQYRPESEVYVNEKLSYDKAEQGYRDGHGIITKYNNTEISESEIMDANILYGVDVRTSSSTLKGSDNIYGFGVKNKTAMFANYTGDELPANKAYLKVSSGTHTTLTAKNRTSVSIFEPVVDPEAVLLGDVDVDGAVTITDVVKMVNVVLNESADDVIMKHGDVNGDGDLDVADVVAIVNKVLGVENDVKSRKVNSVANGGDEASLELNDGVVDFLLSNSSAFCAFQFYMSAEDGLDCKSIILSARAKGHTVSMNKLTDGRYKVMCYSGVNKSFDGSEGELFNILTSGASGKLALEDLFFVTPGASKVKFGNMDIDVVATGISGIDADEKANTIFDLSGRRVQKAQKGVYIVNGKKVIFNK